MILSLFGALAVVASLYDAYKPRDDDDSEVASDDVTYGVAFKMTEISSQQPPAYHVNMAYTTSSMDHGDVNVNNNNAGDVKAKQADVSTAGAIPEKVSGQASVDVTDVSTSKQKSETMDFKKDPGMRGINP